MAFKEVVVKGRHFANRYKTTKWTICPCPMQAGNVECSYYVMRFMYDIISSKTNKNSITKMFSRDDKYTQADLDFVKGMWCKALLRYTSSVLK
ncbi:unnamed protein product [Cuscuta europaea]|uniref:Uncharacterized protein n=1 Tax=Cuscuta europaea TaxID=41803 RepID=A0A9P0Z0M4_CUSEU|nr:unnamed protein product [Cuscuta europaea]